MASIVKTCKYCGKDFKSKSNYLAHVPCKEMIDSPDFENAHRVWLAHERFSREGRRESPTSVEKSVSRKGSK